MTKSEDEDSRPASETGENAAAFEDAFAKVATVYAQYRPEYPPDLFAQLASLAPGRKAAWDCGTGNGQSARGLAHHFRRVYAGDASQVQLSKALKVQNCLYLVSRAEQIGLAKHSIDLVTSSEAVHWFDLDLFYPEVKRVLKPAGILAVWCYELFESTPQIDQIMYEYGHGILEPYWSPHLQLMFDHYRSLPFPFEELPAPEIKMTTEWDLGQLLGYLHSWSATQNFYQERGYHPLKEISGRLAQAWGAPEKRRVLHWPLYFRVGKVPEASE